MRIALVTTRLEVGGLETVLKSLAYFFKDAGHRVDFIETSYKGRWSEAFGRFGFNVITAKQQWWSSRIRHVRQVASMLRNYSVIFLNDAPDAQSVLGVLPRQIVAIPILHCGIPSFRWNAIRNIGQWDVIVAVSPGLRDILLHQDGVPSGRVVCIPNGVEVPNHWPKAGELYSNERLLRVAYVGRIEKQLKGVMHLPGIMRKVKDRGLESVLTVVGDGPDVRELKKRFAECCSDCSVVCCGALQHVEALRTLSKQDVLLMPSYSEGMPIVLLEAMAAGVVPIASRLPGRTDCVVRTGENGLLIEVGDEDAFAAGVYSVGRDRRLLKNLSRNAWQTVSERFNSRTMGESYLKVIEDINNSKNNGVTGTRSCRIDSTLLGDLPSLPLITVRPIRKLLRVLGLWRDPQEGADYCEIGPAYLGCAQEPREREA